MGRYLLGIIAVATIMLAHAAAQPAKVDPQKAQTAKEYVNAGLAAQNAKDYETAISMYQKAYDLIPHPVLLFNIAQAHRLAGRDSDALTFYERYLQAEPKGSQAAVARDFANEIKAKQAEATRKAEEARLAAETQKTEEQRKANEARNADAAKKAEEARKADEARKAEEVRVAEEQRKAEEAREAQEALDRPGRTLRIAGIAVGGVGIVSVGASVFFGLRARSISDELSQPGAIYDPARIDDGEAAERNAIITGIAGGALVAGGAVAYYLGHKQRADANANVEAVSVIVRPDLVGFAISGVLP